MSNNTKVTDTAGVVGPDESPETILMGEDLTALTPVEETANAPEGSTEGLGSRFHFSLEGLDPKVADVIACDNECEGGRPMPPCVSRVIDAEGKQKITIILDMNERKNYIGLVIGLINSASENDVVDITVMSSVSGQAGTMSQRSILSAIDRCKGTVITRAGALTTVGDVAIWLSGDEPRCAKMSSIFMRQPVSGYFGDTADFESKLNDYRESMKEFCDFIVERGLFSQEELDKMYSTRGILSLFGDELQSRVKALKTVE